MTAKHRAEVIRLSEMLARFTLALDTLVQLTTEAESIPDWRLLHSRMRLLENRIGGLCDDVQMMLMNRRFPNVVDLEDARRACESRSAAR